MPNLQEVIQFLKAGPVPSSDLASWLKQPENAVTSDVFIQTLLPIFQTEQYIAESAYGWIENPQTNITLHSLIEHIFSKISNNDFKRYLLEAWVSMPNNQVMASALMAPPTENEDEDIATVRTLFNTENDQANLKAGWLLNPAGDVSEEEFKRIYPFIQNHLRSNDILLAWVNKKQGAEALERLRTVLSLLKSSPNAIMIIASYLWLPSTQNKVESLLALLPSLHDENVNAVIKDFFYTSFTKKYPFDATALKQLIENTNSLTTPERESMATTWLAENPKLNLNDFSITLSLLEKGWPRHDLLVQWAESLPAANENDVKAALSALTKDDEKYTLIRAWCSKPEITDPSLLLEQFPTFKDPQAKKLLIKLFLTKYPNASMNDFLTLISLIDSRSIDSTSIDSTWTDSTPIDSKYEKFTYFIEKIKSFESPIEAADLQRMISEITPDKINTLIENWLQYNRKTDPVEALISVLPILKTRTDQEDLISFCVKLADKDKQLKRFVDIAKKLSFEFLFDYHKVLSAFNAAGLDKSQLFELCKTLYPDYEFAQTELFLMTQKRHMDLGLLANPKLLTDFACTMQDDNCCLQLLEFGIDERILSPSDVILATNDRLKSNYKSLALVLNIPLRQSLIPDAITDLENLFGELPEKTTLLALFSYYDLKGNFSEFKKLIDPTKLQEIKDAYRSPIKSPYVTREENNKLIPFGIDPLPGMIDLCGYLQSQLTPLPTFAQSMAAMPNTAKLNEFKNILRLEQPADDNPQRNEIIAQQQEQVVEFFRSLTQVPLTNPQDKVKLHELIMGNKNEFAYIFSLPNGLGDYLNTLVGLGDGCVANIGMKTKIFMYSKLIKDPEAQILYPFFCSSIAIPFLNIGADKLGGSATGESADILRNPHLLMTHISPNGIIEALGNNIFQEKNGKKILEKLLDSKQLALFYDNTFDMYGDKDDADALSRQQEGKVAAYLIIKKSMPDLLKNSHFDEIANECESWLTQSPKIRQKM